MRRSRATTLLETMIGAAILSGLTLALFFIYRMGASAWKKGEAQTEMLQDLQGSIAKLTREAERSTLVSLTIEPGAIAFLSPLDAAGQVVYDPASQRPIWQRYVVMYYEPASQKVYWRVIPLAPGAPEMGLAEPIQDYDAGGLQPLASYRAGGTVIATHISRCEFSVTDGLVQILLESTRDRYGSDRPERFLLESAVAFRN